MKKLIKITEEHYIVVDDSEIREGDWIFNYSGIKYDEQVISQCTKNAVINWQQNIHINNGTKSIRDCIKKITHSTQPLEQGYGCEVKDGKMIRNVDKEPCYDLIKPLSLLEVEEAIHGYSDLEKYAWEKAKHKFLQEEGREANLNDSKDLLVVSAIQVGIIEGFLTHKELTKDKLFTAKDMRNAMNCIVNSTYINKGDSVFDLFIEVNRKKFIDEYIQSLLPKTEWDVTFKNSKLELL